MAAIGEEQSGNPVDRFSSEREHEVIDAANDSAAGIVPSAVWALFNQQPDGSQPPQLPEKPDDDGESQLKEWAAHSRTVVLEWLELHGVSVGDIEITMDIGADAATALDAADVECCQRLEACGRSRGLLSLTTLASILGIQVPQAAALAARLEMVGFVAKVCCRYPATQDEGDIDLMQRWGLPNNSCLTYLPASRTSEHDRPEWEQLKTSMDACPWFAQLPGDDIRIPHEGSLTEWLATPPSELRPDQIDALIACYRAQGNTARDEMIDIAWHMTRLARPNATPQFIARWVGVFAARFISPEGRGRSLEDVARIFGLTRERIRQICNTIVGPAKQRTAVLPAVGRVLAAAQHPAAPSVAALNDKLRDLLGADCGIESVMHFAEAMGVKDIPVERREQQRKVDGEYIRVKKIFPKNADPWKDAALKHAKREADVMGCCNVMHVAGKLAIGEQIAPGRQAIVEVLESSPGFRWLDTEGGWFQIGDSLSTCGATTRVRKIMAVAQEAVSIDEIASALITDDVWLGRDRDAAQSIPPIHVLREMLAGWTTLEVVQQNRFRPAKTVGVDVLSETERAGLKVILSCGGVAARHQVVEQLMEQLDITEIAVNAMLGSSPIIRKIERGLYGIVGVSMAKGALTRARESIQERRVQPRRAPRGDWRKGFSIKVSTASLRHEQYWVPERFRGVAGSIKVEGHRNVLRMAKSGHVKGLKDLFPNIESGDEYWVEVLESRMWRIRQVATADKPGAGDVAELAGIILKPGASVEAAT